MSNNLNRELQNYLNKNNTTEKRLKLKVVHILNKIFDKRHNFLIENAISWIQKLGATHFIKNKGIYEELLHLLKKNEVDVSGQIEYKEYNEEVELEAIKLIKKDIPTLFPETMKTTISFIDKQNKSSSKFKRYVNKNRREVYDFDHLMDNKPGKSVQSDIKDYTEVLPTMLAIIMSARDSTVENETIKLLMRCFSQRQEFN